MSTIRMSVYTLMGLVEKDVSLAAVTDKKSGRVFEIAIVSVNVAEITLDGRVDAQQNLPETLVSMLQIPSAVVTDTYRVKEEIFAIRERSTEANPQSWAVPMRRLTRAQQRKLIAASELMDATKGPIIPRFILETGIAAHQAVSKQWGLALRPKGLLFSSKAAKGKSKSAKAALRR